MTSRSIACRPASWYSRNALGARNRRGTAPCHVQEARPRRCNDGGLTRPQMVLESRIRDELVKYFLWFLACTEWI